MILLLTKRGEALDDLWVGHRHFSLMLLPHELWMGKYCEELVECVYEVLFRFLSSKLIPYKQKFVL